MIAAAATDAAVAVRKRRVYVASEDVREKVRDRALDGDDNVAGGLAQRGLAALCRGLRRALGVGLRLCGSLVRLADDRGGLLLGFGDYPGRLGLGLLHAFAVDFLQNALQIFHCVRTLSVYML